MTSPRTPASVAPDAPDGDPVPRPSVPARLRTALGVLALDVAVPFAVYLLAGRWGSGPTGALLAGGAVPAARAALELLVRRRPAPLALLMLVAFGLGAVLSLLTGDPRFALAKDAVLPGVLGLVALASLGVAQRPLMFHVRRSMAPDGQHWDVRWRNHGLFRRAFTVQTVVWGLALIVSAVAGAGIAYAAPLDAAALLCPATSAGTVVVLIQWSHWHGWRVERRLRRVVRDDPDQPGDRA